jgi:ABC-type transport system substrate-binding protein
MNDANGATTPESIHGQAGDFAGLWGEWTAVDETTIEFDFVQYDATWNLDFTNSSGQAFTVQSKRAFDEMGAEWVRNNVVGTGPYMVEEWLTGESVTLVNWGDEHWKFEPKTDRVQLIGVAEPTQRLALLRTGEVDAAHLEPKDAARLDNTFTQTDTGAAVQLGIFFSGNLWETENAITGDPIVVPSKETCVHDLPWIGCPGIHDTNAGDSVDDLQQAANIRRALAMAIDRETVNDQLLNGLGVPVHVEYFSIEHPRWQEKWEYPYDPQGAMELILAQDRDYANVAGSGPLGGHAFEISIYAGPELGAGAGITGEVADAVAGYWNEIGLSTFSLKFSYQTFRPTVVGRSNTIPFLTSCDKGRESNPWHFPKGLVETSLTRGGFSCGLESPVILELYQRMATAPDQAAALVAADEYLQYVYDQSLQPGVVAVPDSYFFNNKKISAWEMDKAAADSIGNLWTIELTQ